MPAIEDFTLQQRLNRDAIVALLENRPVVPGHAFAVRRVRMARGRCAADLVKAIVAVEPNGPPFFESENLARPTGFATPPY